MVYTESWVCIFFNTIITRRITRTWRSTSNFHEEFNKNVIRNLDLYDGIKSPSYDESEWEESDEDEEETEYHDDIYLEFEKFNHANAADAAKHAKRLVSLALAPMKKRIVDRVKDKVWELFNYEWTTYVNKRGGDSTCSPSPNSAGYRQESSSGSTPGSSKKRARNERGDSPPDDNSGQPPRRSRSDNLAARNINLGPMLACPFHKHSPSRYNIYDYRSCAGGWKQVFRVKSVHSLLQMWSYLNYQGASLQVALSPNSMSEMWYALRN